MIDIKTRRAGDVKIPTTTISKDAPPRKATRLHQSTIDAHPEDAEIIQAMIQDGFLEIIPDNGVATT